MGGSVGVFELIQKDRARTHTEPKSTVLRLMVSRSWSISSPTMDTQEGERDCVGACGDVEFGGEFRGNPEIHNRFRASKR